ncbi:ATP-grasp domain-containing protein [Streptomyces sp. ISL-98]|uniref:ATP-grasp domain-containing protein n=1 Tax=Streptomyces sp. ISL-98 TaxID=2819192 RepID=UPI001BED3547|nr:ATP-grasp domain-containing protein [Streptomyces sp. ISL-98]MBT2506910.1 ATP-grasp domain-containing protein [Streptomyces sp. ISL-98]
MAMTQTQTRTPAPAPAPQTRAGRAAVHRIAFLRSIEIQQTAPYLSRLHDTFVHDGVQAKLFYTDGDCTAEDFPGESAKISTDTTADQLVAHLLQWRPDAVISLSIADENALRDALVKEELARHGIPMVMHGVDATRILANKWDTKELVRSFGLDTPEGMLLDGDLLNGRSLAVPAYGELVERSALRFGFPLLTKPLWDCLANGISFLDGKADLHDFLGSPFNGNVVLEKCVQGELCSVEIVGHEGAYVIQPLIWKGATGGKPEFTFGSLRYAAPRPAAEADFVPVAEAIRGMCARIGIEGAAEIEMIYTDGTYQIIEINPRVSGSTTLSIAASGCNTYACLVDLAHGRWTPEKARQLEQAERRLAFQFPATALTPQAIAALESELDLVRATRLNIDGVTHGNVILSCDLAEAHNLLPALQSIAQRFGLISARLLDEIDGVVRRCVRDADHHEPAAVLAGAANL